MSKTYLERTGINTDSDHELGSLADLQDEQPLDFTKLHRMYFTDLFIKVFNRAAIVALLFSVGYLSGYSAGQNAPHLTDAQVKTLLESMSSK